MILVTGAAGYVGSRLVPHLLDQGHRVRASFTDLGGANSVWWHDDSRVELVQMDVFDEASVRAALDGIDTAYYLIHSLASTDFEALDARAATTFGTAASRADVRRVVYLSGLVPQVPENELSTHLRSRLQVEHILADTSPATTLRAAMIIGGGSTSLELMAQLSSRLPAHVLPAWMNSRIQPIAVVDVLAALAGAAQIAQPRDHYDIGGPTALRYGMLLWHFSKAAHLRPRPRFFVPFVPPAMVAQAAGSISDAPPATVHALIDSLAHDMTCADDDFVSDLLPAGWQLCGLDESLRRAIAQPTGSAAQRDPMARMPHDPDWTLTAQPGALGRAKLLASTMANLVGGR